MLPKFKCTFSFGITNFIYLKQLKVAFFSYFCNFHFRKESCSFPLCCDKDFAHKHSIHVHFPLRLKSFPEIEKSVLIKTTPSLTPLIALFL